MRNHVWFMGFLSSIVVLGMTVAIGALQVPTNAPIALTLPNLLAHLSLPLL